MTQAQKAARHFLSAIQPLRLALPALLAAFAACGPNTPAPKLCGTNQVICGTECVDITSDTANCGLCGNVCSAPANGGTTSCVLGECTPGCSGGGLALCDAAPGADGGLILSCTDTDLDPNNCGGCGIACGPNDNCVNGACAGCASGMLRCPGGAGMPPVCLAILSDNANCGGCGVACGTGTYCDNGACVAVGDTNCGNADGGATSSANLDSDRLNCGTCGNVCADSETCTSGRCEPCPVAQCGNSCTDTTSDSLNCGGCAATMGDGGAAYVCAAGQACYSGACGAGVIVEMLGPADGGLATPGQEIFQLIQVTSALPISSVAIDGPTVGTLADGGPSTHSFASLSSGPQGLGSSVSTWTASIPAQDAGWNGVITATAYDTAWSTSPAAAQPQHSGSAQATIQYGGLYDGGYAPAITVTAGGTQIAQGGFIPLGAGTVTLSVPAPAASLNLGQVQFQFLQSNLLQIIGTGTVSGSNVVLQVSPGQLPLGNGVVYAIAYAQDGVTEEVFSTPFPLDVGSIANNVPDSQPILALADAGPGADAGANVWWLIDAGAGVGQLATVSWTQPLPAGLPDAGFSDAGYYEDSLVNALNPSSIYAVTSAGAVDRFNCANSSAACYQHGYVTGLTARRVLGESATSMMLVDNMNRAWFAPAAGGAAVAAGGTFVSGPQITSSGAMFAVVNTSLAAATYQLVAYSPAAGLLPVGDVMPNAPDLAVYPSGEFIFDWQLVGAAANLRAGAFDGTTLSLTPAHAISQGLAAPFTTLARPGVIIGSITTPPTSLSDGGTDTGELALFEANVPAQTIAFPVQAASSTAGFLANAPAEGGGVPNYGVEGRDGTLHSWEVSDDQLKALLVTQDTVTAADGTQSTSYSLWLVDLPTSNASLVYSTPNLLPFAAPGLQCSSAGVSATMAPHFVHSAAGAALATGAAPSAAISAVPAIVFNERLDPPAGGALNTYPVRVYTSKYAATGPAGAPAALDRYATLRLGTNRNSNCAQVSAPGLVSTNGYLDTTIPFVRDTAANGGAILFIGEGSGSDTSLYAAPLFPASGTTITSTKILDSAVDFRTREDSGRLLALRGDGNLYSGMLGPSPTLALAMTGGSGGTPPTGLGAAGNFGFTSDGAHAYLAVQPGGQAEDWNGGNLVNSVLGEVDLTTLKRTDFGTLTYGQGNLSLPALFLDNGLTAFGVIAPALGETQFEATLSLWGAMAPDGTRHFDSGQTFLIDDGSSTDEYQFISYQILDSLEQSLDGTEGRITLGAQYYANIDGIGGGGRTPLPPSTAKVWLSPLKPNTNEGPGLIDPSAPTPTIFVSQDGTEYGGTLFAPQSIVGDWLARPATYSPFGGPYTPDYELYSATASSFSVAPPARVHPTPAGLSATAQGTNQLLFKRWGNGFGPPHLLATGNFGFTAQYTLADQSLITGFATDGSGLFAPTLVKMPGHLPPKPLLP